MGGSIDPSLSARSQPNSGTHLFTRVALSSSQYRDATLLRVALKTETNSFAVDTKLFRELGELLVGRESTALMELVKNSYDADATRVSIYGENLSQPELGRIVIRDNGNGMDVAAFRRGFLTIAGRAKSEGDRRSPRFDRRYTGAKGVGRLAAHKLAHHLAVRSLYPSSIIPGAAILRAAGTVRANIDWDLIEKAETIDSIKDGIEVFVDGRPSKRTFTGTVITLARLRRSWSEKAKRDFVAQAVSMTPPDELLAPPPAGVFVSPPLFQRISASDARASSRFDLHLEGEFESQEELMRGDPASASLLIEIKCDAETKTVTYVITPSNSLAKTKAMPQHTLVVPWRQIVEMTERKLGIAPQPISFNARIFERDHLKTRWPDHLTGVRVYMEGFRVLPYGEKSDDWLYLKSDYTGRSTSGLPRLATLAEQNVDVADLQGGKGEALSLKPDHMYMGAVLLKQDLSPGLKMLINREGFLPGPDLDALANAVRVGIDLATRARFAAESALPRARAKEPDALTAAAERSDVETTVTVALVADRLTRAIKRIEKAVKLLEADDIEAAESDLSELSRSLRFIKEISYEALAEQSLLRVLASLGITLAAFAHEVGNLVGTASDALRKLDELRKELSGRRLPGLTEARQLIDTVVRGLERQASFLVDVTSAVARRRRSRMNLRDRANRALALFHGELAHLQIAATNVIDEAATSPAMFPAELTMVFANLISNAIKAAGEGGRIAFDGRSDAEGTRLWVSNSGVSVDVASSERWFLPFQSTTSAVSAALGQGMGLGLTITRSILDEYGASIRFAKARKGFATTVEIHFPRKG